VDVAAVFVGGEALQGGKLASKTTKLLEGVEAAGTEVKLLEAGRAAEAAEVAGGGGTKFFRGAKPGEAPNFTPKPNEFKVDRATGHVKDTHGVSVFDNPESVSSKGFVPHEIDQATIPESLRTIQRGKDPAHYEITPKPGANLTPDAFIKACGGIQCR
jgi:hypothetical protein